MPEAQRRAPSMSSTVIAPDPFQTDAARHAGAWSRVCRLAHLSRWHAGTFACLLAALAVLSLWRHATFFHDDAFITLRYARNLAEHGQPVWNAGEWVEGYTSLLHLALLAGLGRAMGAEGAGWMDVARVISALSVCIVLVASMKAARRITDHDQEAGRTAALVLAASAPLWVWLWGGLEATLAAAWVSLAMWGLVRAWAMAHRFGVLAPGVRRWVWASGACMALSVATRPDTLTLVAGGALAACWGAPSVAWSTRWRLLLRWVSPVLVVHASVLAWRWQLYHELAPNTYYAKVQGIAVWHRLRTGSFYLLKSLWDVPFLPAAALAFGLDVRMRQDPIIRSLVCALAAVLAGVLWVGGDHMPVSRFLVPSLPLLVLLAARWAMLCNQRWGASACLVVAVVATALSPVVRPTKHRDPAAWAGEIVGQHIHRAWPVGSLVALNTAGAPPFQAPGLRFIDMLGLNDSHIAHRLIRDMGSPMQALPGHMKGDGAYVLARQPDFIVAGFAEGQLAEASEFMGDRELAGLAEFRRCYRVETVTLPFTEAYSKVLTYRTLSKLEMDFTYYRRVCPRSS